MFRREAPGTRLGLNQPSREPRNVEMVRETRLKAISLVPQSFVNNSSPKDVILFNYSISFEYKGIATMGCKQTKPVYASTGVENLPEAKSDSECASQGTAIDSCINVIWTPALANWTAKSCEGCQRNAAISCVEFES